MHPKHLFQTFGIQHTVHPGVDLRARCGADLPEHVVWQWAKALRQQSLENKLLAFESSFLATLLLAFLASLLLA